MKKLVLSTVVAGLVSTNVLASECATLSEKIGFGAIGVIQGAVIGGPVGAVWGLGTIIFANEAKECKENILKAEEETITLLVQNTSINKNENLDEIKTVKNPEAVQTFKEVNSFVNFAYDKYDFKTANTDLQTLNTLKASKIEVEGHTDAKGTDEYNFALGLKRANSVKAYIIKNNVPKNIITVKSFGEAAPISNVASQNRRVDLKITYK